MVCSPKVSILCPSYNHGRFVGHFIKSVLEQTEKDFELIIIDDCSNDNNIEEIEKFSDNRIKLVKHTYNQGINATLNEAISLARGVYSVIIASDDMLYNNHLKSSVDFLDNNTGIGVFYCSLSVVDDFNRPIKDENNLYIRQNSNRFDILNKMFFASNLLLAPGAVIRSSVLKEILPLDFGILQYQDYQMHINLLLKTDIHQSTQKLVKYRMISNNENISARTSVVQKREELEEYKLLDSFLSINNLEIFKKIFDGQYNSIGEPTIETIPYFLGMMAILYAQKEIRRNWGYNTIMNFLEKKGNLELLNTLYGFEFKDYISLVNKLDLNNSFDMNQKLLILVKNYMEKEGRINA